MIQRAESEPESEPVPVDRDERLGEAIEEYLELVEGGQAPDPEAFAAGHPDLGEDLVAALGGLAMVRGLVGDPGGPGNRLEEGRRVAGYRIVRELGRGGMGIVYEAVHVGLDRPVALKVLGSQAAPDSSGRRRFLNEAKTAAGLHHTHIVPVFDVGQVGGLCYYAMQRIEGSGLDRVLRLLRRGRTVAAGSTHGSASPRPGQAPPAGSKPRPRPDVARSLSGLGDATMSWAGAGPGPGPGRRGEPVDDPPAFLPPRGSAYYRWVADAGRQAAEALAHAHQRGVIHRDIKPSNLLIDARGMVWVADFGLARRLADPSQTQVDSLLGTPRYMSPEQARTGAIDGRADVYSLGATLYELVTLRPPFDGQSAAELITQISTLDPPRPRRFDPRVPLDLETILLKALAKRPDDRYPTADALAEDLARFLAHEPVRARRIGPVGRAWRFARRHPGVTSVSAAAASLVLTTATVAYVRVVDARDRADEAAAVAQAARSRTERANDQLQEADRKLRAEILEGLEKQATNVRLSAAADRRSIGLELLRRAAAMSSDPALRVRLRDQALAFLSIRDVEARPPIETPGGPRHGPAFGPNGRRIASLSDNGELEVWDVAGRERVDASRMPVAPPRSRPTGRGRGGRARQADRIAAAGDQVAVIRPDGAGVRFFDVAAPDTPVDELAMKGYHVTSVLASADGRRLVTVDRPQPARPPAAPPGPGPRGEPEEPRVCLWDRDHPDAPRATLALPPSRLDAPARDRSWLMVAIAPDGSRVAAGRAHEAEVAIWDGDGRPLPPIDVPGNMTALALGPAGQLAVAGIGGEIALWDLTSPKPRPLTGLGLHQSFVTLLRFSPRDGSILAAAGMGGGVELWDWAAHALIAALPTHEEVGDLAFSADGRMLAAAQPSSIATWAVVEPTAQGVLPDSGDFPVSMAFGPGDLLAIASRDNQGTTALRLWAGPGRGPISVQAWPQVRPGSVGFDDRGRLFALEPEGLRWYRPPATEPVAAVDLPATPRGPRPDRKGEAPPPRPPGDAPPPRPPSWIAARSPDGRALVLGRMAGMGRPNELLVWRAAAPGSLARLDLPESIQGYGRGAAAALDPAGDRLYYLADRGNQVASRSIGIAGPGTAPWTARRPHPANILALSPDGKTLALGERSGAVVLVDAAGKVIGEPLTPPAGDSGPVEALAFSPDGGTLAVGSREQIRLWAIADRPLPLVRLPGHRGSVRLLAFDARGARLAGADEKTVKVWDLDALRGELGRTGLGW